MLAVEGLDVYYDEVRALRDLSLRVDAGEIVALIGPNGAGKTTVLKSIIGLLRPRRGRITFLGTEITGRPTEEIVRLGIALAPEGRRIFPGLTVYENLEIATCGWRRGGEIREDLDRVFAHFPRLRERMPQPGWSLSGGEQQMLSIGRALMARPRLLMMDEPSLGLGPLVVRELFATIREINTQGTTVLLVEQNAYMALKVAHRAYVLENGHIILADRASALAGNERVKQAYLGG